MVCFIYFPISKDNVQKIKTLDLPLNEAKILFYSFTITQCQHNGMCRCEKNAKKKVRICSTILCNSAQPKLERKVGGKCQQVLL